MDHPTDLAKLAINVARARHGATDGLLSPESSKTMLTPQPAADGSMIGFFTDPTGPTVFVNNGADLGFQTMFRMDYDTGEGAVMMANGENGFLVMTEYMRALAKAHHWKSAPRPRSLSQTLVLTAKLKGIDAAMTAYERSKSASDVKDQPTEQVLSMLGSRMMAAGDTSAGLQALEKNVAEYPLSADALVQLGQAFGEASRKESAMDAFRKALTLDPQNADAKKALLTHK